MAPEPDVCPLHATLAADIVEIKKDIRHIRTQVDVTMTKHTEQINLHRKVIYGGIALILGSVVAAIIKLII